MSRSASAVGLFAKFLPLLYRFQADARLSEVTRQIEATMHEASRWQGYFGWESFDLLKKQGQEPFCPLALIMKPFLLPGKQDRYTGS